MYSNFKEKAIGESGCLQQAKVLLYHQLLLFECLKGIYKQLQGCQMIVAISAYTWKSYAAVNSLFSSFLLQCVESRPKTLATANGKDLPLMR